MGCVAASGYTSGEILSVFSTGDASVNMADCVESCGVCCYPVCDTSPAVSSSCPGDFYSEQTSEEGYVNYYTYNEANHGGPQPDSSLFDPGYYPLPANHIIAGRSYICEGGSEDGCGNGIYGVKEGFQAKVLQCNLDGTWTDVGSAAFSSVQQGASCAGHYENNLFHANYMGLYWDEVSCAMTTENACGSLASYPTALGPWYDWEYSYELIETRGDMTEDGSNCFASHCVQLGAYNAGCAPEDPEQEYCVSRDGAEGYSFPCLGFCEWSFLSSGATFLCADSGQTTCNSMQGLWITGTTCESYDCNVHNT